MKVILAVLLVLGAFSALGSGVTGETDYQKGVHEGLWVGLHMGQLLGLAQSGNLTAAAEFNGQLDKYHAGLIAIFGNDSGMKKVFFLPVMDESQLLLSNFTLK